MVTSEYLVDSEERKEHLAINMVSIGSLQITVASLITFSCGVIIALMLLFTGPYGIFVSLYVLLLFVVLAYNVNCAQVGHCTVWAWVLTAVYLFYTVVAVLLFIFNYPAFRTAMKGTMSKNTVVNGSARSSSSSSSSSARR